MPVYAITPIRYGTDDGGIKVINVGDELGSDFSDEQVRDLILGGSAVETGKDRKYTTAEPTTATSDETRKRDELIAKALFDNPEDASPAVRSAVATTPSITEQVYGAQAAERQKAAEGAQEMPPKKSK